MAKENFHENAFESDERSSFRENNELLGNHWSLVPDNVRNSEQYGIKLIPGPVIWFRIIPSNISEKPIVSPNQIRNVTTSKETKKLLPMKISSIDYLKSKDGVGVYSKIEENDNTTNSITFVFRSGNIWSIDTGIIGLDESLLHCDKLQGRIASVFDESLVFFNNIKCKAPFKWKIGIEGILNKRLASRDSQSEEEILIDKVVCGKTYNDETSIEKAIHPFFEKLYDEVNATCPPEL
jgi:hypothetical protein